MTDIEIIRDRIMVPGPAGTVVAGDSIVDLQNRVAALEANVNPVRSSIVSGYYYGPLEMLSGYAAPFPVGASANTMDAGLFRWPANANFQRVEVEVVTAVAGGTIRLGVYNIGPDGFPTTKVLDLGTIDASVVGSRPGSISGTLARGQYWIAGAANVAGIWIRFIDSLTGVSSTLGHVDTSGTKPRGGCYRATPLASGFTTLPATFGSIATTAYIPAFWIKAS